MSDRLRFGFDGGDVRELMKLAAPVVTVQLGMMLMNVVDSAMVGHYSAVDLAAVGMGSLYIWGISVVAVGVLMAPRRPMVLTGPLGGTGCSHGSMAGAAGFSITGWQAAVIRPSTSSDGRAMPGTI